MTRQEVIILLYIFNWYQNLDPFNTIIIDWFDFRACKIERYMSYMISFNVEMHVKKIKENLFFKFDKDIY